MPAKTKSTRPKHRKSDAPLDHRRVVKRRRVRAKGKSENIVLSLADVSMKGVEGTRVIQEEGRLRVSAEVGVKGFDRRRRLEEIPVTQLTAKNIAVAQSIDVDALG